MLIALSQCSHVNATAPCMSCGTRMHFTQARPPMSCIPLVIRAVVCLCLRVRVGAGGGGGGGGGALEEKAHAWLRVS